MNVSLTPELERLVSQASIEQLRRDVGAGVRALDRGEHNLFDDKTAEAIKREGRRHLARRARRS